MLLELLCTYSARDGARAWHLHGARLDKLRAPEDPRRFTRQCYKQALHDCVRDIDLEGSNAGLLKAVLQLLR